LTARGWLLERTAVPEPPLRNAGNFLALNENQQCAYQMIARAPPEYRAHLLHGITGSGKTEIYLHLIRDALDAADQALVLVPEIGLTDQLVTRFRECFGNLVAVVHSGLGEAARIAAWHACREKRVKILLGTRSAVWLPLPSLRLVIVDEEHDLSYKQQDGLRYSARDVAVMRARRAGIPVVLGSATPSLESFANCESGKYRYVELTERAGGAEPPVIKLIDVRSRPLTAGISEPLRLAINAVLERGEQVLVFLNRRGYAPIVLCHRCGWIASCERCDARLVLHKLAAQLRCHHCGAVRSLRADFATHACGRLSDYVELGIGTEQIESTLTEWFPDHRIVRIDRDTMTRKGQLERALAQIRAGYVDIVVGTQMISKGHHFAGVTLVAIVDADSRLLANDFRAEEHFMQLVIQVAGRAGRGKQAGTVLLQTHHPHHPIFPFVVSGRYKDFVQHALRERKAAELPPFRPLALLRAEATVRAAPLQFLQNVADALRRQKIEGVSIDGPIAALMEKRVGKFRANLMLLAQDRQRLARTLSHCLAIIEKSATAKKVRWTLDVDAQDVL
ncbi:MAG: replication restart helicase PriA, partial [Gammaproteobacteria bacterium]